MGVEGRLGWAGQGAGQEERGRGGVEGQGQAGRQGQGLEGWRLEGWRLEAGGWRAEG